MLVKNPDKAVAKGDVSSNGSKVRPALSGDRPLTAWALCGTLTTMATNGKPMKKAVLYNFHCQQGGTTSSFRLKLKPHHLQQHGCQQPILENARRKHRFLDGSFLLNENFFQPARTTPAMIARTSVTMMAALFHGYRLPPSSRAKTSSTEETSNKNMPLISTRANSDLDSLVRRRSRNVSLELVSDVGRHHVIKTRATSPPGTLS